MKVIIASKSPFKVKGIQKAFRNCFREDEITFICVEAESGVESQPIGDKVFEGAQNRIAYIKKAIGKTYDYVVGCEGGILEIFGKYYNAQFVVIEDANGKQLTSVSTGLELQKEDIPEILKIGFKKYCDQKFGIDKGGISILTNGLLDRTKLIEDTTTMALGAKLL